MPETVKRDYTAQSKHTPIPSMGPVAGSKGKAKWATPQATRGKKTPGIGGKPTEMTAKGYTKRTSLR